MKHASWIYGTLQILTPEPRDVPGYTCDKFPGYGIAQNESGNSWGIIHVESKLKAGGFFEDYHDAMGFIENCPSLLDFSKPVEELREDKESLIAFQDLIAKATADPRETCEECRSRVENFGELVGMCFCRDCLKLALMECDR